MPETNPDSPAPFTADGTPTLQQLVDYAVEQFTDPEKLKRLETTIGNAGAHAGAVTEAAAAKVIGTIVTTLAVPIADTIAKTLLAVLESAEPVTSSLAKIALDTVLGDGIRRAGVPGDIGHVILSKLQPAGGTVEPSIDGAAGYMSTMVSLQMETWLLGMVAELFGDSLDMFRGAGVTLQSVAELRNVVTQVFGGGRITRRVLAPFIDDSIVAPAKRWTSQQYRPTLLSAADAIRQLQRGRWTRERAFAELAQQGWSDERIEALINAQRKFFSPADVREFVQRGYWTSDVGIQHLKDQGYEQDTAVDSLRLEGLKRIKQNDDAIASAITTEYVNRTMEKGDFDRWLGSFQIPTTEIALVTELAELRRSINVKRLSSSQVEACVKAGVLAFVDYREALAREGYPADDATALELLLRAQQDKQKSVDDHRKEMAAEAAAAKQAKADAAAARKAEVDAQRALQRLGPLKALERAAVLGLIPLSRVEAVLTPQYDADTVGILMGLVQADRQSYLDQQAKAAEAAKRAAVRNVDVGTLQQAVLDNELPIQEFRTRLAQLSFAPADIDLLVAVTQDKKADQDAAQKAHDDAAAAAKIKHIDLARLELLVRRGARTLSDYDALLGELGFDEPSRAAMGQLLQLKIADDQKAAAARAAAEAKLQAKGLSFDQFRNSVILGTKSVDQFNSFLVQQSFTADAVQTLVADARIAVDEANAARQRRTAAATASGARALPLSTVAQAARLGVITPDDYQARLAAAGYSADDVAIEMDLLVVEIANVQTQRARRDLLEAQSGERGLSLAQLEKVVKAGDATIEDYRARAASLNYSADDVAMLVALLQEELAAAAAKAGLAG